ncbi:hypothetical protein [Campylobacter curvus]|uniref:hypothetical protein n=1 Tax=Campylobacter curvus TaxID=200 RepID=UPI00146FC982|nr:hypothetical protein [Campylobacter curvus]
MRKIFIIFFTFFICLYAKEQTLSNIPPASIEYINLEPEFCDEACLKELVSENLLASFMARFEPAKTINSEFLSLYNELNGKFTPQTPQGANKIAVIIPQKTIKSYASVVTNSLISYVANTNAKVELKFIMSGDESAQNITSAINTARDQNISYFIAPFTPSGVRVLDQNIATSELAYVPSVNASLVSYAKPNIIFGGIDYQAQIAALLKISNDKITAFSDASGLGETLNEYVRKLSASEIYEVQVAGKELKLDGYLSKKSKFDGSSVFLNLPVIKASLVATQMRGYEITPFALLSTQINYIPNIFGAIAQRDRQNLYIANSVNPQNDQLVATNALFDVDLRYSQIGYSCSVGLDYIYSNFIDLSHKRLFSENLVGSQIVYDIKLFEAKGENFTLLEPVDQDLDPAAKDLKNDTNSSLIRQGLE